PPLAALFPYTTLFRSLCFELLAGQRWPSTLPADLTHELRIGWKELVRRALRVVRHEGMPVDAYRAGPRVPRAGEGVAIQIDEGSKAYRLPSDDRHRQRQAEPACPNHRCGRTSHRDPYREGVL